MPRPNFAFSSLRSRTKAAEHYYQPDANNLPGINEKGWLYVNREGSRARFHDTRNQVIDVDEAIACVWATRSAVALAIWARDVETGDPYCLGAYDNAIGHTDYLGPQLENAFERYWIKRCCVMPSTGKGGGSDDGKQKDINALYIGARNALAHLCVTEVIKAPLPSDVDLMVRWGSGDADAYNDLIDPLSSLKKLNEEIERVSTEDTSGLSALISAYLMGLWLL